MSKTLKEIGYKKHIVDDGFHYEELYTREGKYATNLRFDLKHKVIIPYYAENKAGAICIETLQAINEKVKELKWI